MPSSHPRRPAWTTRWACAILVATSSAIVRGSDGGAAGVALASPGKPPLATDRRGPLHHCFVSARARSRSRVLRGRAPTWRYSQYEGTAGAKTKEYFVSDAQFVHLGPAARILTEEFYAKKTNFVTFQLERIKTVLSLESTFPNQPQSLRRGGGYSGRPLQYMLVACNAKNGEVVGFAEVDARPLAGKKSGEATAVVAAAGDGAPNDIIRSYMYNLAVDKRWKRRGIASALVRACEEFVADAHESCLEKRLYLRVRKCNRAAVALYEKMGYSEMQPEVISLNKEDINYGSLEEGELILLAKDLPLDAECVLD